MYVFIGPESDLWLPLSVTVSPLTDCCLVNLMALNDANCLMMSQQLLEGFLQKKTALQNGGNTSESKVLMCWLDAYRSPNPHH